MSVSIAPYPRFKAFYPATGTPLSGGFLYTVQPGTTVQFGIPPAYPLATYTDSTGLTQNLNPVVLDSNGEADVWLSGYTKLVLYDSAGNLVWSKDNVSSSPALQSTSLQWVPQSTQVTFKSATEFIVPGSQTAIFSVGTRIQATITGGEIYGTVAASSSGGAPIVTTVTVAWDSTQLNSSVTSVATSIITGGSPTALPSTIFQDGSIAAVATAYAADTYLSGSAVIIPVVGGWKQGAIYKCEFDLTKTAAAPAGMVITFRMGILGTTADAAIGTITLGAGTAAADTGILTAYLNFRSVGAGTAAVCQMALKCDHLLAATGLTNTGAAGTAVVVGTTAGFDSTTQTILGISVNGGASFSGTNTFVQASLRGM